MTRYTGAPTILHKEWTEIGATELLQPGKGACLVADMSSGEGLAAAIRELLGGSEPALDQAGHAARAAALHWGQAEYDAELAGLLSSCRGH